MLTINELKAKKKELMWLLTYPYLEVEREQSILTELLSVNSKILDMNSGKQRYGVITGFDNPEPDEHILLLVEEYRK